MSDYTVIGKSVWRKDAMAKVRGAARYTVDLELPGMLYGKILRSPYHHARIVRVDTSRAKKLPGVRAILTPGDVRKIKYGFGEHIPDMTILSWDKVRFKGDEVAAVAAVDDEVASEALNLIEVEYEELPAVFDPEEAMSPGAPLIHEAKHNIPKRIDINKGDVDEAFSRADHVFEDRFKTQRVHQCYLEPVACLASWDSLGKLTFWIGSMNTSGVHQMLARALDLPESKVRLIQPEIGGSFGSKVTLQPIFPICALLARAAGRPLKMVLTREEEFTVTRPRINTLIDVRTAVKSDGRLLARQVRLVADCGAYCDMAAALIVVMSHRSDSVYRIPNIKTEAMLVYTNKSPIGAYRGYGNPQMTFAFESQLDMMAERLGIDPVDLRLKNATRNGDVTVHGWEIKSCGLAESIEKTAGESGWKSRRGGGRGGRGLGMACMIHECDDRHSAGFAGSNAIVEVREDGRAAVISGEGEYGQGSHTIFAQIASEVLGLPYEDIDVVAPDTDRTPYALGPWGSRVTLSGGLAVKFAAEDALRQILSEAAQLLEASEEDLQISGGIVSVKGLPSKKIPVAAVAKKRLFKLGGRAIKGFGTEEPSTTMMDPTRQSNPCSAYSFAAQVAEVEVDESTGAVKVLKFYTANDVGKALNPAALEGQIEGSVLQGIGQALSEEIIYDDGHILNPTLYGHGTAIADQMPPVVPAFVETIDPYGPYGAKGGSELGLPPVPAAIANAIYDAVGVRIKELPITPDKVLKSLQEKRGRA